MTEYANALKELQHAWDNFNNATSEYICAAIHHINAVEEKIKALRREMKLENVETSNRN